MAIPKIPRMRLPAMPKFPGISTKVDIISTSFAREIDQGLAARGTLSLVDYEGSGTLMGVVLVSTSKDKIKLRIKFEDQTTNLDFSAEDAHSYLASGRGTANVASGIGLGCNLWNPISGYYGIVFSPSQPLGFKNHLEVWIYNSDDAAHTILDAWVLWNKLE